MSLLNRSQVKQLALDVAANTRKIDGKPKFTRVSGEFLDAIESFVRQAVTSRVQCHPSIGKTLK